MIMVNGAVVIIGLAVCSWCSLENFLVDMRHIDADQLSEVIQSNEICPFIKASSGLKVQIENRSVFYSLLHLKASIFTFFDIKQFFWFWTDQVNVFHFFEEILLVKRFLTSTIFSAICIVSIEIFVVQRRKDVSTNEATPIHGAPSFGIGDRLKLFVQDKILILMFCIPQGYMPNVNKKYIDFGEYARDKLSFRSRSTDLTVFASWFCLVAVVQCTYYPLILKAIQAGSKLPGTLQSKVIGNSSLLISFLTLLSLVTFSTIILGSAVLSYAFLHPTYSTILVIESCRIWLLSLFAVLHVSIELSKRTSYGSSAPSPGAKEAEVKTERLRKFEGILLVLSATTAFLLNALCGVRCILYFCNYYEDEGFVLNALQMFNDISAHDVKKLYKFL